MTSAQDGAISRRGFLLGAAAGLATGVPATWFAARHFASPAALAEIASFTGQSLTRAEPAYGMPGRYPGRVIEVRHPAAVSVHHDMNAAVISAMIDRGMSELTGNDDPRDVCGSWGQLFSKDDVVGIKVNPVGRKSLPGEEWRTPHAVGAISNFEVLVKVVKCLRELGIPSKNIIVFERYAKEFDQAGYVQLLERELPGVRWLAAAHDGGNFQLNINGFDQGRDVCSPEMARHVVGYDPDVFTSMGYCHPEHSADDDRRFRSHLTVIVSRMINKLITLPVLKDHRSAGVTLSLKNMSHGLNNNVARSHLDGIRHGGFGPGTTEVTGPNQCNTFIPQAVAQHVLRQKATLHILDGLIGVYEGGPGSWNQTWGTWRHQGLLFATDPVALDHVGWDIIDRRRLQEGWEPVGRMGLTYQTTARQVADSLTPLAARQPLDVAVLSMAARKRSAGWPSEVFNRRQPEHIVLAGELGLGVFARDQIYYRSLILS